MAEERQAQTANSDVFRSVYDDTIYFVDGIVEEYKVFPSILEMMRQGNASIELRKRYLLRAIDEAWVNMIEDTLPSLDLIIRNPSKFIEEKEELLPVEMTRKVSVRTLQHLSQHTNLISRIEGDTIIPTKLLNVFKEETLQTYENKFVNTLISRLYAFVNRRYEIAKRAGQDQKTTSIEFKEDFEHDKVKVRMNFRVEIAEDTDTEPLVDRNYSYTTDLWKRVERLNKVVTAYADSEFVQMMGKSYIRPPVMRTNAILKNKNLHQCYLLWQFIESYDSAGYSMLVQEDLEKIDEGYIKELYSTLALQYLIFRYNIKNEFEIDSTLASKLTKDELRPHIVDELKDISEHEFDLKEDAPPERIAKSAAEVRNATLTPEDMILLQSLDIAMDAVDAIAGKGDEEYYSGGPVPEPEPEPDPEPEKEFVPPQSAQVPEEEAPAEAPAEEEPVEEPVEEAPEAPVEEAPEAPAEEPTEEAPVEEPTEEASVAPDEEPTEEAPEEAPAEEPVEESIEEAPSEEAFAAPTEEAPAEAPVEEPVEQPPEALAEEPVETSVEAPVEEPVEAPAKKKQNSWSEELRRKRRMSRSISESSPKNKDSEEWKNEE